MAHLIKRYGWICDLPDHRDFVYKNVLRVERTPLPAKVDFSDNLPPCWDQLTLGSCTAHATAAAVEHLRIKLGLPFEMCSRLFNYYNGRDEEGNAAQDSGAALRDVVDALAKIGTCDESLWPYDISKFAVKPAAACYEAATQWRISVYARLSNLEDMLTCLAAGHGFVFGFTVYDKFESEEVAKTGIVDLPAPDEGSLGGHAVYACGYDLQTSRFLVRNSWGTDWGLPDKPGYFTMPFAYLTNPNLAEDFWTIRV